MLPPSLFSVLINNLTSTFQSAPSLNCGLMHWFPGSFLKNFHVSSVTSWCLNIWQVSNPGIEIAITMTSNSFWTNSLACSYKINYCQTFFPIKESKETSAKIYVVWLRFCQTIIKRLNNQTTLLCS